MHRKAKAFPSRTAINHGFTLLEVMISLAVLGLIVLMVFGVFRMGISAWERGDAIKDEYQKMRVASQLISRQIKSAVPYKIKSSKAEGDHLAFEGSAHSLKFVSALPWRANQAGGFVYVVYEFKEGGREGGKLILYEQRVLNKDFMAEEPKEESGVSLFEEISNVHFEYYRQEKPDQNKSAEWLDAWNAKEEKELPSALRMTLVTQKGKEEKEEKKESPITILASFPSNRFEEVRVTPSRRLVPMGITGSTR